MRRIVVNNNITLDGVTQGPGRPDEDTRGGFAHGGWARPYTDEAMGEVMGKMMSNTSALLMGKRTYEDFASFWPKQPKPNPFTDVLDSTLKHVATTTPSEPLEWENSVPLGPDVPAAVDDLKKQGSGDVVILGSGELVRSLMPEGLIDEYVLAIHPLVLGTGQKLFGETGAPTGMELIHSTTTTTGVIIAVYRPKS